MVEVEMSKDIRDIEPKLIGPFTKRQTICSLISLSYGVPLFFVFKGIPIFTRILIIIVLMMPVIACGWCDMYGMHLEQFAMHLIRTMFLTPRKRKYEEYNLYEEIYINEVDVDTSPPEKRKKRSKKDGRIR